MKAKKQRSERWQIVRLSRFGQGRESPGADSIDFRRLGSSMHRRDVLRLLATGAALQLAPGKMFSLAREVRLLVAEQDAPRSLNAHQFATVKTMAELIIPRTDTPGATDVGVAEFIDLLLTEWYDDKDRKSFVNGLDDVDARSNRLFGKTFVDCSPVQQSKILTILGEQMINEDDAEKTKAHDNRTDNTEGESDSIKFYPTLRNLTMTAFYTSEDGATGELHFEIVPGRFDGCARADHEGPGQP
jgi:gluconate 2-dehydrogenase gamma chain